MPLASQQLSPDRVEFARSLTVDEVDRVASDPEVRVLQCASETEPTTWDLLNSSLFPRRPDIELRVYGFYSSSCDLSFVTRVRNVRRFSADCLMRAEGIEYLSALEQLEALSVGIYNLESFDFLVAIPNGIKTLSLGPTKSKKPRLDSLVRFQSLNKLCIAGQQQRIEALAELQTLEDLSLRRISTPDLDYISRLPRLSSLDIKLGGIRNLSAIQGKASIKYLELWRIRGLSDITVISSLTGLQYLFLQDLRNVISIPDLSKLTKLHRIYLENMKGLEDFGAVSTAPALEDFIHVSAQNVSPASYKGLLAMPTLRQVRVRFCSQKKNQEFDRLVAQSGKSANPPSKFGFS